MDEKRIQSVKKIFISSPSDVYQERLKAEAIIKRLDAEFSEFLRVEPVLWERLPLTADASPQTHITDPGDADIVIVILWSRLGTVLADQSGTLTHKPVTGTEWEFEQALASYQLKQAPEILVYRKTTDVTFPPGDKGARAQLEALEDFIEYWFIDPDNNTYKRALLNFKSTTEFEVLFEEHLRHLLGAYQKKSSFVFYKNNPFRGLFSFELKDAPLFFGRTRTRNELYKLLQERIKAKCAFVLVHGASGCGKSSLVKSGLLADLKASTQIAFCRHAILRPADGANNLMQSLIICLFNETALPELTELRFTPQSLKSQFIGNDEQIMLPVLQALTRIKDNPKNYLDGDAKVRLVLIIDQLEELFTGGFPREEQDAFIKILTAFSRSGLVWVIATMRSDFLDWLDQMPDLSNLCPQDSLYLLKFPEDHEIEQIIRKPAALAGLEFELDHERGYDLADQLCQDIAKATSSLPLLEFTLDQLWQQRTSQGLLTFSAYANLGGLEGALGRRAEDIFRHLPDSVQAALPILLRALATAEQGLNAKITARWAAFDKLSSAHDVHQLIEAFLDPKARLLVSDGDDRFSRIRVSHEALLNHWERAKELLQKDLPDLQIRSRLMQTAMLWQVSHTRDWLLPEGLPLLEAQDLLKRREAELDSLLIDYIKTSVETVQAAKKRNAVRTKRIFTSISLLAVTALLLAGSFFYQKQKADKEHKIAESGVSSGLAAQAITLSERATDDETVERAAAFALESWGLGHNADAVYAANKLFRMLPKFHIEHDAMITALAISSDNRLLATGTANGKVRLIEIKTGKSLAHPALEPGGRIFSIVFSKDGKLLAIGSQDAKARVLEIPSGKLMLTLPHDGEVQKVSFSPDSRLLATASTDRQARIFETTAGRELQKIPYGAPVRHVLFSPDGNQLAIAVEDGTVHLVKTVNGAELIKPITYAGYHPLVNQIVFDSTGRYLAGASQNGEVLVMEVNSGRILKRFKHEKEVFSVTFHPSQFWLATAGDDAYARVFDLTTGKEITHFAHFDSVFSVRFSPDGRFLATASIDKSVRLFACGDWHEIARILHGDPVWQLTVSNDSRSLATGSDKVARIMDTVLSAEDLQIRHRDAVFDVALNPKRTLLATASKDKTAKLIDIVTGAEVKQFNHQDMVYCVAFSMDGRYMATASKDRSAKLVDIDSGAEFVISHDDEVRSIAFSPDSRLLATAGMDKTVKLIDVATGKIIKPFVSNDTVGVVIFANNNQQLAMAGQNGRIQIIDLKTYETKEIRLQASINRMDFSPDGRFLATANQDGYARLINLGDGHEQTRFEHSDAVLNVVFSPDGRQLAMSSMDNTARLIDLRSTRQIALIRHAGPVTTIAFNVQGSLLATGSQDGIIRIIDTATGQEMERINQNNPVWTAAFSQDGQLLAAGDMNGTVKLYNANPDRLIGQLCSDRMGRNLNVDEIRQYLPTGLAKPSCERWRLP